MSFRLVFSALLVSWLLTPVVHAEPPAKSAIPGTSTKGRLPITISKATTYITEPLRPDGYPDYLAALNQQASKGVTPESNAVVALMQAFGPEVIDRRDRDKFFKMLGVAPPPDTGAYFVDYDEYVKEHAPDALKDTDAANHWQFPLASRQENRAGNRPWSREECPLVAGWLAQNEKPLALIVEASKRPRFYFPLVMRGDWLGSIDLFPSRLPMRSAVRYLTRRAMLRLHEGQTEQAWNDLQTCHRLARLPGWGSTTTWDCLTAMTCDGMACYGDRWLAHFVRLTPEPARTFCADMEKLPPVPALGEQLNGFERFLYLDSVCATARGRLKPSDIVPASPKLDDSIRGGDTPAWKALRKSLTEWIGSGQIDWDEALRLGNEHFDQIAALIHKPTFRERSRAGGALDKELDRQRAIYGWPRTRITPDLGDVTKKDGTPRLVFTQGVFVVYLAQLIEMIGTYADSRSMINSQLIPIALALSAYRTEHGQYPDKLGSLQPQYVARLPRDPWGTGDYRYHRQDDGYLLYSVGPNGVDNTGPLPHSFSGPADSTDDIGIRMPDRSDWDDE